MTLPSFSIDDMQNGAYRQGAADAHATLAGMFDRLAQTGNPWAAEARDLIRREHDREFLGAGVRITRQPW